MKNWYDGLKLLHQAKSTLAKMCNRIKNVKMKFSL